MDLLENVGYHRLESKTNQNVNQPQTSVVVSNPREKRRLMGIINNKCKSVILFNNRLNATKV